MERAKADDDDGNRAFGDGGGEEEEALLKKEITKLTKKAQTLTVINTALQQENEKLREIGGGGQGGREFNDEQVATIIRELEEDLEKLRAENLKLLVGGEDGKEYLNEEEEERVKALKSRMHQLQASLQTNELKLAEEMNERERLERVRQRQDGEIENLKVSARERQEELRRARQFSEQLRVEFQRKEHAMKKRFEEELSKNPTSSEGGGDQNSEMDILRRELKQEKERGKDLETRIKELEESMNVMESRHGKEQDQLRRETRMAESRARQCEEELTTAEAMRAESIAPLIKQMEIVNEEKKKYEMLFNSLKLKVDEVDALDTKRREALEVVKETQTLMHEMREREGDLRNQCASMEKQLQRARIQESELREREKVIKAQLVDTRNELEASVKFGGGGGQSYNSMEGMRREREEEEEEYVVEDGFEFGTESDTNQTANVVIQALKHKLKEASNRLIRADIKRKESEKSASEMHYKTIDIERELEKQKKEHATLVELLGEKIERLEFLENSK